MTARRKFGGRGGNTGRGRAPSARMGAVEAQLAALAQQLTLINTQFLGHALGGEELAAISAAVDALAGRLEGAIGAALEQLEQVALVKAQCSSLLAIVEPSPSVAPSTARPAAAPGAGPQGPPAMEEVTEDEFAAVPKYMRGRMGREKVSSAIEFINRVVAEKYALLRQNPARLSVEARQRFFDLKSSECDDVANKYFITDADIKAALGYPSAKGGGGGSSSSGGGPASNAAAASSAAMLGAGALFKLDATGRSILSILRHLGRMREVRGGGLIRYTVL